MRVAYIAHPVAGDVKGNIDKILAIVRKINLEEPEVVPFVPYLADIMAMDDNNPIERKRGIKNDQHIFYSNIIDELRLYGPRISTGMQQEIITAEMLGIPVVNNIIWQ